MQEVFEKIIERLEENQTIVFHLEGGKPTQSIDLVKAIEIVTQTAAEYNNGWIPCSENDKNFPADCERVRVTLWFGEELIGYRKDGKWFVYGGCGIAEADVMAWQPTEPYQPEGE